MKNGPGLTVSVVMPNYNGRSLLEKNLPSLVVASQNANNKIIEIIVVDDGSIDESIHFIKKAYPQIRLIKHSINRGFSAAVNTGVRHSKGEITFLINNDVTPERDFLKSALKRFDDPKVFAVSLHEDGFGPAKGSFLDGFIELEKGKEIHNVSSSFYVNGGSGLFRKKVWTDLGGMDEKLLSPFYWEDIDICYRAAKRGYLLLWEPDSRVRHQHESTIGSFPKKSVERIRERNQLLMLWKNITSPTLTRKHIIGVSKRLIRHPGYARIILMALSRFGIAMQKRKKEIKESKMSDEAVFARYA